MRKRICIVTPGYIASTPRVVREADALAAAGFDVRVVFSQGQLDRIREHDRALLASRPWRHASVGFSSNRGGERWAHLRSGLRHRVARAWPAAWNLPGIAERGEGRVYPELAQLAAAEAADLYIGHYPAGLASAAWAAKRHGARLGYDVEDLYADTFPPSESWAACRARIITIEERYVPDCVHISAVSQPIAEAFEDRYRPTAPICVVHNCHPWSDRASMDRLVRDRRGPALSLYWYSQVIGLDRGIQDAIKASSQLPQPAQIHLRGVVSDEVRTSLSSLARECGLKELYFHEAVPPEELLSRAAEHDVGLALEVGDALNKQLTASNKLFLYMTAGLAIAATDVPGQKRIVDDIGVAGRLYRSGDHLTLAGYFRAWQEDPHALDDAKCASLEAARRRWNAEYEERTLVTAVERLFAKPVPLANVG